MRRRALLATLAASTLGGCASQTLGNATDGGTGDLTNDRSSTTAEPRTDRRTTEDGTEDEPPSQPADVERASIVDLETISRTYALSPTQLRTPDHAHLQIAFAKTATADEPAVLRVWLRNENPFSNTFRLDEVPGFGGGRSDIPRPFGQRYGNRGTYRQSLVLAPTDSHELVDSGTSVERDGDGLWRANETERRLPETVDLDAGESVFAEYHVVGHPDGAGGGRPTGVYEFTGYHGTSFQIAVWETNAPGPSEDSRFQGDSLPSLGESATTWYHEADSKTQAYVDPSTERGTFPERVRFTVVNKSREPLQCGHWQLYKLDDGEWFHVAPYGHTADCRILVPGRAKTYALNAYHGEALDGGATFELGSNVGWLGPGRYAVVAGYGAETNKSAALVDLTGEERTIVPTEDASATMDGATVRVSTPRHDVADDENRKPAVLTVERVDDGAGDGSLRRLIPEQVMRDHMRGLRNTLAFVEDDVDRVVLETDDRTAENVTGYDTDQTAFRFENEAFEVEWEEA